VTTDEARNAFSYALFSYDAASMKKISWYWARYVATSHMRLSPQIVAFGTSRGKIGFFGINARESDLNYRGYEEVSAHEGDVTALCKMGESSFESKTSSSKANNEFASGGSDSVIKIWQNANGRDWSPRCVAPSCTMTLKGHEGRIIQLVSMGSKRLASASVVSRGLEASYCVKLWDLTNEGSIIRSFDSSRCILRIRDEVFTLLEGQNNISFWSLSSSSAVMRGVDSVPLALGRWSAENDISKEGKEASSSILNIQTLRDRKSIAIQYRDRVEVRDLLLYKYVCVMNLIGSSIDTLYYSLKNKAHSLTKTTTRPVSHYNAPTPVRSLWIPTAPSAKQGAKLLLSNQTNRQPVIPEQPSINNNNPSHSLPISVRSTPNLPTTSPTSATTTTTAVNQPSIIITSKEEEDTVESKMKKLDDRAAELEQIASKLSQQEKELLQLGEELKSKD